MKKITFMVGVKDANNAVQLLGSCFVLPKSGLVATCRHVIGNHHQRLVVILMSEDENGYQDTTDNSCKIVDAEIYEINPLNDIAVLKINGDIRSNIQLGSIDNLIVGDVVQLWGYPFCNLDSTMHILTLHNAHVGAKIIKDSNSLKLKYAIMNTQTRPGQSGSLVYSPRLNKIVGILVGGYAPTCGIDLGGINPYELNQTSFCLSAEYINEMI